MTSYFCSAVLSPASLSESQRRFKQGLGAAQAAPRLLVQVLMLLAVLSLTGQAHAQSLTGEEAIEHLKTTGQYESLAEAINMSRYQVQEVEGEPEKAWLRNPKHGLNATFDSHGLHLHVPNGEEGSYQSNWRLESAGGEEVGAGELRRNGQRLEIVRPGLTEWFINRPSGLEHGLILEKRPAGAGEVLELSLAVDGDLAIAASSDGQRVELREKENGGKVLDYDKLRVWDANKRELPARMAAGKDGLELQLQVDDAGAKYPLTIDPTFTQEAMLKADNAEADDRFGVSVSVSGDTVVVGADFEDSSATGGGADNSVSSAGAAYVYVRNGTTWSQQAMLKADNAEADDRFGGSVSVSGDTVVVGAIGESSSATGGGADNSAFAAGAAYVYVRSGTTWSQQAMLKADNAEANDVFGWSVSVSGDTVVVGARDEDSSATGGGADNSARFAGAAYVYERSGTTWSQQAMLKADNAEAIDNFGNSVSVSGDTVVVGANRESSSATGGGADNSETYAGAAYVYERSGTTWSQQAMLKADNGEAFDFFGISVSVSGDTVVVGAYLESSSATGGGADNSEQSAGAAYVYVRSGTTWSQHAMLKADNAEAGDQFGLSVSVSGDIVVVGANGEDSSATGGGADNSATWAGAAYIYRRNGTTWSQQAMLKAGNAERGDRFGYSVSVSGDTVVVGAIEESSSATGGGADNSESDAGAAYVFRLGPEDTYVDSANDYSPNSPAVGDTVTWKPGTPEAVTGLVFGTNAFSSVQSAINATRNGGTVHIAAGLYDEGAEISIAKDITLIGDGPDVTELTGNSNGDDVLEPGEHRVLTIDAGAHEVTLTQLAIINGKIAETGGTTAEEVSGAGLRILSTGSTTIDHLRFEGNKANRIGEGVSRFGGGIYNGSGTLTVSASTFSGNSASFGGGIFNIGTLTVSASTFSGNSAQRDGGGIYNFNGTLTVSDSTFSGNSASSGGGIFNIGTLTVSDNTFSGNSAQIDGGGIYNGSGTLTVSASTFSGNSASFGGGIFNSFDGTLTVSASTFSGNSAQRDGGGIYSNFGTVTVNASTFSGNSAQGNGGGIYNFGTLTVNASTFSGNSAQGGGGGIFNDIGSTLTVSASTFSGNSAELGGGISNNGGTLTLNNSLVVGNSAPFSSEIRSFSITDNGGNLIGIPSGLSIDNILAPLADNGGPIQTHALVPGSPAIDMGLNANIPDGVTTDQRGAGFPRLVGASVDIGAFEFPQVGLVAMAPEADASGVALDGDLTLTFDRDITVGTGDIRLFGADGMLVETIAVDSSNVAIAGTVVTITPATELAAGSSFYVEIDAGAFAGTDGAAFQGIAGSDAWTFTTCGLVTYVDAAGDFFPASPTLDAVVTWKHGTPDEVANLTFGTDAFSSVQAAIDATCPGGTVHIAAGLYDEGAEISIGKDITLIGDGPDVTELTGNSNGDDVLEPGEHRVLTIDAGAHEVTLTQFAIINGKTAETGGTTFEEVGGAGLRILSTGSTTIDHLRFEGNKANRSGGAPRLGGGIYNLSGTLTMTNATFTGNSASSGGGIYNRFGTLTMSNSTFTGNSAERGGGIYNNLGTLTVSDSTFSGNSAQLGGGIYNNLGTLTVSASTFSGNSAQFHGGGIFHDLGTLTVSASTFSGNSAQGRGGGIYSPSDLTLNNSLVVGNSARFDSEISSLSFTDNGGNLIGIPSGLSIANILAPLADNGGPTQTHALVPGSPAIDMGLNANIPDGVTTDQRGAGFSRLIGASVDIGAFEAPQVGLVAMAPEADASGVALDGDLTLTFDRDITVGTGDIRLFGADGMLVETIAVDSSNVAIAGTVVTITPATELAAGSSFYVEIDAGAFAGTDGAAFQGIAGSDAWTFTTCGLVTYVDAAGDFFPASPALDAVVTWKHGTPDEVANLTFGTDAFSSVQAAIDATCPGGTVHIAAGLYDEGAEISIGKDITLIGDGPDVTELTGNSNGDDVLEPGEHRVLTIDAGAHEVTLTQFAIINGKTAETGGTSNDEVSGAGLRILSTGSTTIDHLRFEGNKANQIGGSFSRFGGGIYNNRGTLTVSASTFSGNSAERDGGGIYNGIDGTLTVSASTFSGNSAENGGGIYYPASGTLTVSASTFSGNSAQSRGGGIINRFGTLTVSDSTFSGNSAQEGGGIYNDEIGTLTVSASTFSGNSAQGDGGGIANSFDGTLTVSDSTFSGNSAQEDGGGIYNFGTVTVSASTFSGNSAQEDGGGIFNNGGTVTVSASTFSGNSAQEDGGGINNFGTVTVSDSTFSGNSAERDGGGISNDFFGSTLTVSDSTFSGNSAQIDGGGIFNNDNSTLTVSASTFSGNSAQSSGGGIYSPSDLTLNNSLVVGNSAPSDSEILSIRSFTDNGGNLIGIPSGLSIANILAPLADNGGPTQTHALVPGNPAIDMGLNANIPNGVTTDQRGAGFPRLVGASVDIGAFEAPDEVAPVITLNGDNPLFIECPDAYTEPGATTDDGSQVIIAGTVGTELRDYQVHYDAMDAAGNVATRLTRTVTVRDTTPPVITLTGGSISVPQNGSYVEPGFSATDACDQSLPPVTSNAGALDTTALGEQMVTYSVTDASGNMVTTMRTVTIVDEAAPVITLNGDNPLFIECPDTYVEPGATTDDGSQVIIAGTAGTALGDYQVHYDAMDAAGNAATRLTRTITVRDTTPPVITLSGGAVTVPQNGSYTEPGVSATDACDTNLPPVTSNAGALDTTALGEQMVTYSVTDASGNMVTTMRTVTIVDEAAPVITLNGDNPLFIECPDTYIEPGASTDDGSQVIIAGTVGTALGDYQVHYDATDAAGNVATRVTRTVTVRDTTPPVITLTGGSISVPQNGSYIEPGVSATDACDQNLPPVMSNADALDTSVLGEQTVTYSVTDASGNMATMMRTVTIVDEAAPVITLNGDNPLFIECPDTYVEPGATTDDGSQVIIAGTVGTALGDYQVHYDAMDAAGNVATRLTRTVTVRDTTPPVITLTGGSISVPQNGSYVEPGFSATDACDQSLPPVTSNAGALDTTALGEQMVTYSVTDASGNMVTTMRTVTIVDEAAPVITLNGDNPLFIECPDTYVEPGASTDDGSQVIIAGTVGTALGDYQVHYDAMDAAGNAATRITRTVTVRDTTPPEITLTDGDITVPQNGSYIEPGVSATDACDQNLPPVTSDADALDTSVLGEQTVTYQVTDASGLTATATRTVTIVDEAAPVIMLTGNNPHFVECPNAYDEPGATADDGSEVIITGTVGTELGDYQVFYDATDAAGNAATRITRTVTVRDTTPPVITLTEGAITVPQNGSYIEPGVSATDACDQNLPPVTSDADALDTSVLGEQTVTYQVTDASGLTVTATRTVTIVDEAAPVIMLTGNNPHFVECPNTYAEPGATADDGSEVIITGTVGTELGDYQVFYDATDAAGNAATRITRTVTVRDTTPPVITLTEGAITVPQNGSYMEPGVSATDACDQNLPPVMSNADALDTSVLGEQTVTYQVTDASGLTATATRTVTIVDEAAPVIMLTGNNPHFVECPNTYAEPGATADDGSEVIITGTVGTELGDYQVFYDATDAAGNAATRITRTVTVRDTTPPEITLTDGDITVPQNGSYMEPGVSATDACDQNLPPVTSDADALDTSVLGEQTVTYQVTDASGLTVTATRTVTIVDEAAPVIMLAGNNPHFVECPNTYAEPGATADDGSEVIITGTVGTELGDYQVFYDATDAAGNAATRITRTVTVRDTTPPEITLTDGDITVPQNDSYMEPGVSATDACDQNLPPVTSDADALDTSVLGEQTVTYQVTDASGLTATATRTVTIVDEAAPVIMLTGNNPHFVECPNTYAEPGATADDGSEVIITGTVGTELGDYQVFYDATDAAGNAATRITRTVTVRDTTPPVITLTEGAITVPQNGSYMEPGVSATDACDQNLPPVMSNADALDTSVLGEQTVTYQVTDASGLTATATRTVTIVDEAAPVIMLTGNNPHFVECPNTYAEPGATADDGSEVIITGTVGTELGDYQVFYDATDAAGNAATRITRTVTVRDTTPPVITLTEGAITVPQNGSYMEPGVSATDACDQNLPPVMSNADALDTSVLGEQTVTYQVTDASGNMVTTMRTVTIVDEAAPVITLNGDNPLFIECPDAYIEPGATTDDGSEVIITGTVGTELGDYQVFYDATDAAGNAATRITRTVTVRDTTPPVITLTEGAITVPQNGSYMEPGVSATDACDQNLPPVTSDADALDTSVLGEQTVTYSVTDASGNMVTTMRTVTIVDEAAPVIMLTGNNPHFVECPNAYDEPGATADDGSEVIITGTVGTELGDYQVFYDATDAAGNAATRITRTVTVRDTTPPVITLTEGAITVPQNGSYIEPGVSATDACDQNLPPVTSDADALDTSVLGEQTVTYQVTDASGFMATATRTVTIVDEAAPVIMLTGNNPHFVECPNTYAEPGATADDGSEVIITGTVGTELGDYQVFYDATDAAGNAATRLTRTITVRDTTPPVITLTEGAITVPQNGSYIEPGVSATDACDQNLPPVMSNADALDTSVLGEQTVTYSVTDASGNMATMMRTVTIVDEAAPVITLNGDNPLFIECPDTYVEPGATTDDGSQVIIAGTAGTALGDYQVHYDAMDAAGNAATRVTRTVTVQDRTPPVITLFGEDPLRLRLGTPYVDPGARASDACDGDDLEVVVDASAVNASMLGRYAVTYNVSDAAGNAATEVTRTVLVVDGFRLWLDEHFDPEDVADPTKEATVWGFAADPDGDCRLNGFEFLHGSDPTVFNEGSALEQGMAGAFATLSFPTRQDLGGVELRVEVSSSKVSGFAASSKAATATGLGMGLEQSLFEDDVSVAADVPRYVRVALELGGEVIVSELLASVCMPIKPHTTTTQGTLTFLGLQVIEQKTAKGVVSSTGPNELRDWVAEWPVNDFTNHYVLITSGPHVGMMTDIVSNTTSTLTLLDDIGVVGLDGATFEIRPHTTVGKIFGIANESGLHGGQNAMVGDNVLLIDPSGAERQLFYSTLDARWLDGDFMPGAERVIAPHQGIIVRRKQPTEVALYSQGAVATSPQMTPVEEGYNLLSASRRLTLNQLGLNTGDPATGLQAGLNPSQADNLLVINPDGTTSLYWLFSNTNAWVTISYQEAGGTVIPAGTSFYIQRRMGSGAFNWTVPLN